MVGCHTTAYRLSATGTTLRTYVASALNPAASFLFAANLDPDGTTFWTGDYRAGDIYRIDISTGAQVTHFKAPNVSPMGGLAIFGEQRAATQPSPTPSPSPSPSQSAAAATPALPKAGSLGSEPDARGLLYLLVAISVAAIAGATMIVTGRRRRSPRT
jgi:hypothetical protein